MWKRADNKGEINVSVWLEASDLLNFPESVSASLLGEKKSSFVPIAPTECGSCVQLFGVEHNRQMKHTLLFMEYENYCVHLTLFYIL